jgi:hypothetical protein
MFEDDTFVTRIDLKDMKGAELAAKIKDVCKTQAARDDGRRLAAAFEAHDQVVLIFQRAVDNE